MLLYRQQQIISLLKKVETSLGPESIIRKISRIRRLLNICHTININKHHIAITHCVYILLIHITYIPDTIQYSVYFVYKHIHICRHIRLNLG